MRVLSLFSGIGGIDLGLQNAGFEIVGQVEIDPFCQKVLARHWPDVWRFDDITKLTADVVREHCGRVDLICGGFPCQGISVAGKGDGLTDDRSSLWFHMERLISGIRPTWLFIENVPRLRTLGADRVLSDLEALSYTCWPSVVGAWAVGAPHKRDRVWIVAHDLRVRECVGKQPRERRLRTVDGGEVSGATEGREGQIEYPDGREAGNSLAHANGAGIGQSDELRREQRQGGTGKTAAGRCSSIELAQSDCESGDLRASAVQAGDSVVASVEGREKPDSGCAMGDTASISERESSDESQPIAISGQARNESGRTGELEYSDSQGPYARRPVDDAENRNGNGNRRADTDQCAETQESGFDERELEYAAVAGLERERERLSPIGCSGPLRWPARPGEQQYDWEHPRLVARNAQLPLGHAVARLSRGMVRHRRESLKALGNAVVPAVVEVFGRAIMAVNE